MKKRGWIRLCVQILGWIRIRNEYGSETLFPPHFTVLILYGPFLLLLKVLKHKSGNNYAYFWLPPCRWKSLEMSFGKAVQVLVERNQPFQVLTFSYDDKTASVLRSWSVFFTVSDSSSRSNKKVGFHYF